jgi:hypothetical protein
MMSLLQLLHAIAAQRGDGLHPELRKRLPNVDPDKPATGEPGDLHQVNGAARLDDACDSKRRSP